MIRAEHHRRASLRSQCAGKRRYRDLDEAKRNRRACLDARGGYLRIYDCPHCGGFHLTQQEERHGPRN